MEINHKNGIKTDKRLENLEYVTRSENLLHAYQIGLKHAKNGESIESQIIAVLSTRRESRNRVHRCDPRFGLPVILFLRLNNGMAILTEPDVRQIKAAIARGERRSVLARQFGISHKAIAYIAIGRNWRHVA